jgi:hypothetical protein
MILNDFEFDLCLFYLNCLYEGSVACRVLCWIGVVFSVFSGIDSSGDG